ncbi:threonine synthase [Rhodohalobacter mucosus]|uniref:Threonine synthase n=1 Tax=Rhodohalobacter mucosus TaxID=2079485 RepID=A0A316TU79_9BACT|nr:threonine synthase [Rhodohalobacter mucosus]PWN08113.1 threonine synthase [Rhodohalobacter mucosus]
MMFESTKGTCPEAGFFEAMRRGLAPDGGLYMPVSIPGIDFSEHLSGSELHFAELAADMAQPYLDTELSEERIRSVARDAFNFPLELKEIGQNLYVLELFHGPTLAFKDFGARFMARLFSEQASKAGEKITILVATSGDTGSAVANGFYNVEGVEVCILYPKGRISRLQEMQMATLGGNIRAMEVSGVFDDCQRLVKQAIMDESLRSEIQLSSANSINIARLIPQSFYYAYASLLLQRMKMEMDAPVFSVPSGNFGNLTGGLVAERMGMATSGFIAATNQNSVVPEFLSGGEYRPRKSVPTISNAMDVGDPSNFSRIRYLFGGSDSAIRSALKGYWFDDNHTREAILELHRRTGYLMCPHTATGYLAASAWRKKNGSEKPVVVLGTAHPVKFRDVIEPVTGEPVEVPERLQSCLEGEKQAKELKPEFPDFKKALLKQA